MLTKTIRPKKYENARTTADDLLLKKGYSYYNWHTGVVMSGVYMLVDYDVFLLDEANRVFTTCDHGCESDAVRSYEKYLEVLAVEDPLRSRLMYYKFFKGWDLDEEYQRLKALMG